MFGSLKPLFTWEALEAENIQSYQGRVSLTTRHHPAHEAETELILPAPLLPLLTTRPCLIGRNRARHEQPLRPPPLTLCDGEMVNNTNKQNSSDAIKARQQFLCNATDAGKIEM